MVTAVVAVGTWVVTVKAAPVPLAGTVTLAGTEATAGTLLLNVTVAPPPGAGCARETVP
jgi:hypothetical protein